MHPVTNRRGFTLVELLVVIAIISTLMGLLLPAVQNAREAARRNTCSNNLSQLTKGMISFDGSKGYLPSWRHKHPNTSLASTYVSWLVPLLPQIERGDIYRSYQQGTVPSNVPLLTLLQCPTSPSADATQSTTAYSANIGTNQSLTPNATGGVQAKSDGALVDSGTTTYYAAAKSSLDTISSGDGTSNTLALSEKTSSTVLSQASWAALMYAASAPVDWTSAYNSPVFGIPAATFSTSISASNPSSSTKVVNGATDSIGNYGIPSSAHPGGVMASFCDGHVQYVSDSIKPWVYAQIVTSDSRYDGTSYNLNSPRANAWLLLSGSAPYLLAESDIRE